MNTVATVNAYVEHISTSPFLKILIIALVLDLTLGVLRGAKEKRFNSTVGINGAIRKAAMLVCVAALKFSDLIIDINVLSFVPAGYLPTGISRLGLAEFFAVLFTLFEATSVLKNMMLCGLPIPIKIKRFIQKFLNALTEEMPKVGNSDAEKS